MAIDNPYADISDKLGNPVDAMDTYIQLCKRAESIEAIKSYLDAMDKLAEDMKSIVHEFRQKGQE